MLIASRRITDDFRVVREIPFFNTLASTTMHIANSQIADADGLLGDSSVLSC